ncbi:MAG TPA: APC family permease [Actinomycetota bacterium]|nr:APC family permease [Actinomycetota bacterium]
MSELPKTISTSQGVALAVSMVIGSGLLGLPGIALAETGAHATAVAWVATSAAAIPLVAVFARLGVRFASAAGLARYAEEAAGAWAGFGVTAVAAGSLVIGVPALYVIGGSYARRLVGAPPGSVRWFALGLLVVVVVANLAGVRVAGIVNGASVAAVAAVVLVVVVRNAGFVTEGARTAWDGVAGGASLADVWRACLLIFWAFLGWENVSFGLEEFRDRARIPRVYWLSFVLVVALYVGLGFTTAGALESGRDVQGASGLAALLGDDVLADVLLVVMVLVIAANANAWVFGASRFLYGAGRSGALPAYLGTLSPRGVPVASLVTLLGCYVPMILVTTYWGPSIDTLILIVGQNLTVLYAFSVFAYWKTERGPARWPVTLLSLASCAFLLSGVGWWIVCPLVLLALGYARYRRAHGATPADDAIAPAGRGA